MSIPTLICSEAGRVTCHLCLYDGQTKLNHSSNVRVYAPILLYIDPLWSVWSSAELMSCRCGHLCDGVLTPNGNLIDRNDRNVVMLQKGENRLTIPSGMGFERVNKDREIFACTHCKMTILAVTVHDGHHKKYVCAFMRRKKRTITANYTSEIICVFLLPLLVPKILKVWTTFLQAHEMGLHCTI